MVDPQDQDPGHGGGRGEDHHGGVVHADDRGLVCGRQALHHRHQEDRHVQHRLHTAVRQAGGRNKTDIYLSITEMPSVIFSPDSAGIKKTNLGKRNHLIFPTVCRFSVLQCQNVDQNCRLDVVEEKKFRSSPNQEVIPEITREILSDIFPIVR